MVLGPRAGKARPWPRTCAELLGGEGRSRQTWACSQSCVRAPGTHGLPIPVALVPCPLTEPQSFCQACAWHGSSPHRAKGEPPLTCLNLKGWLDVLPCKLISLFFFFSKHACFLLAGSTPLCGLKGSDLGTKESTSQLPSRLSSRISVMALRWACSQAVPELQPQGLLPGPSLQLFSPLQAVFWRWSELGRLLHHRSVGPAAPL